MTLIDLFTKSAAESKTPEATDRPPLFAGLFGLALEGALAVISDSPKPPTEESE